MKRMLALALVFALLLCGCGGATNALGFHAVVAFEDMEYVRPDMAALEELLAECEALAEEGTDIGALEEAIWGLYDAYDDFYTNFYLADIHYNADMTDFYWQTEYDWCAEQSATADSVLEGLFYALADSPLRETLEGDEYYGEGYFDYYEGESIYDETFLGLLEEESALISEYYAMYAESMEDAADTDRWYSTWTEPMAEILAELVRVRQNQATYAGYDSYPEFAYDFYYYRDYTWQEADRYCAAIREELLDIYTHVNRLDVWDLPGACGEKDTFAYVRDTAKAMGGTVEEAFRLLDEGKLYDISVSDKKSGTSFEVFLLRYYEPYILVSAEGSDWDKLTFAHEFGHFANDYALAGAYNSTDVSEFFSQGMEYLSLCYTPDEQLRQMKMADCISTYLEQAAYATFEHAIYQLAPEELTAQTLTEVYEEICLSYGFDRSWWDQRDFVTVPHFYEQPLYIISYVVSNDAALQLYQLETEDLGAGLQVYQENLTNTESWFLSFVEAAGLENPMAEGRLESVRATMEEVFG